MWIFELMLSATTIPSRRIWGRLLSKWHFTPSIMLVSSSEKTQTVCDTLMLTNTHSFYAGRTLPYILNWEYFQLHCNETGWKDKSICSLFVGCFAAPSAQRQVLRKLQMLTTTTGRRGRFPAEQASTTRTSQPAERVDCQLYQAALLLLD